MDKVSGEITLHFDKGRPPVASQVCTECWLRKPMAEFTDTGDTCAECRGE